MYPHNSTPTLTLYYHESDDPPLPHIIPPSPQLPSLPLMLQWLQPPSPLQLSRLPPPSPPSPPLPPSTPRPPFLPLFNVDLTRRHRCCCCLHHHRCHCCCRCRRRRYHRCNCHFCRHVAVVCWLIVVCPCRSLCFRCCSLPPPLPLLAANVIGDGGNCDKRFLAKEAAALAAAVREIFLRGNVQNITLVKVIFRTSTLTRPLSSRTGGSWCWWCMSQ